VSPAAVLIGLPGVGKTTTGRRLAKRLGVGFEDSDRLVEQQAGASVAEVFAERGEAAFRALEAAAVVTALSDFDGVLALGGGAVADPATREALRSAGCPVVLLRASVGTLTRRVGGGEGRPLLAGDPAARLAELARARAPLYDQVKTHVVITDRRSTSRVAAEIAELLGQSTVTQ
jgi:shikimate kinase